MAENPWLANLKALLIDLDGVVYRGELPLPGATRVVETLQRHGIAYAFVTNNATLTPRQFQAKLARMGVRVASEDIVTSPVATASYLRGIAAPGTGICAVGEEGLREALLEAGFRLDDAAPSFVVVGLDRFVTYQHLALACRAIWNGARFIGTNADPALPVEDGLAPGVGAIIAFIATATGVHPTIVGKPEPTLIQVALDRLGVNPADAAMVGDQIDTDIRAGKAAGTATVLVEGDLARTDGQVVPDLAVATLAELLERIDREHIPGGST